MTFKNKFTLSFRNTNLEKTFNLKQNLIIVNNNSYVNLVTFFICLSELIFQMIFHERLKTNSFYHTISNYTMAVTTFVIFICCLYTLPFKKEKFQIYISYLNYFGIAIPFFFFRQNLVLMEADFNFYVLSLFVESILRHLWIIPLILVFKEIFFINVLLIIGVIVISPLIVGSFSLCNYNLSYCALLIYLILTSYFATKQSKLNFFFNQMLKNKIKFNLEILQNMNTGFIKFKGNKINFINDKLMDILKSNHDISNLIENEANARLIQKTRNGQIDFNQFDEKVDEPSIVESQDTTNKIIEFLFSDSLTKEFGYLRKGGDYNNYINYMPNEADVLKDNLIKRLDYSGSATCSTKFTFLFNINLELNNFNTVSYEIFGRKYEENGNEICEFIFNDVTRIKLTEQMETEFKMKSLFLSKISHELKNPLICCNEIINQTIEHCSKIPRTDKEDLIKNLNLIDSLSNYLLILVKDIEFFSVTQNANLINVEFAQTKISSIIDFCTNISKGLISKNKKNVDFIVEVDSALPSEIYTDETKLKQLLVNLQSNSIKFTNVGHVKFSIKLDSEDYINFTVSDTGLGMNEATKSKLFKPFNKSLGGNNKIGSGLGLTICLDLLKLLNGKIDWDSEEGKGSTFNIKIPYRKINQSEEDWDNQIDHNHLCLGTEKLIKENDTILSFSISGADKSQLSKYTIVNDCVGNKLLNIKKEFPKLRKFKSDQYIPKVMLEEQKFSERVYEEIVLQQNNSLYVNNQTNKDNSNQNTTLYELVENYQVITSFSWNIKDEPNPINKSLVYIVADDEHLTRQSSIRILKSAANKLNKKICIYESRDGAETLWLLFQLNQTNIKVSGVITDQNMMFFKGSNFAYVARNLLELQKNIKIYMVSSFDQKYFPEKQTCFNKIFSKPLCPLGAKYIINEK